MSVSSLPASFHELGGGGSREAVGVGVQEALEPPSFSSSFQVPPAAAAIPDTRAAASPSPRGPHESWGVPGCRPCAHPCLVLLEECLCLPVLLHPRCTCCGWRLSLGVACSLAGLSVPRLSMCCSFHPSERGDGPCLSSQGAGGRGGASVGPPGGHEEELLPEHLVPEEQGARWGTAGRAKITPLWP